MKNYTPVYVQNSIGAPNTCCDAFGAQIIFAVENSGKPACEHCE